MQVPEKLTLIGGSILLASTLIFTLKSQASNILPKVDNGMSSLVNDSKSGQSSNDSSQKQQQAQADQTFNNNFQQAQQKGWQTGQWGTAKFYVDDQSNMHVGSGQLQSPSYNAIGQDRYESLKTITLDGNVQAPMNSIDLFGEEYGPTNHSITAINGLNNLDTSQVTETRSMFGWLRKVNNLDTSHFDTHNVTDIDGMFEGDISLSSLDLSHFDTHGVKNMSDIFNGDISLSNLNLSHFDTYNIINMDDMFDGASIHQLNLGNDTKLNSNAKLSGTYQSNGQTLNLDGNAHPGTWIRQ